jgi:hypothetical protein
VYVCRARQQSQCPPNALVTAWQTNAATHHVFVCCPVCITFCLPPLLQLDCPEEELVRRVAALAAAEAAALAASAPPPAAPTAPGSAGAKKGGAPGAPPPGMPPRSHYDEVGLTRRMGTWRALLAAEAEELAAKVGTKIGPGASSGSSTCSCVLCFSWRPCWWS